VLQTSSLLRDRYRIEARLGEGGMGAVYRAFDEALSVTVAVKENLLVTEASQRQFEREARLLAGLRHPNLPRVTDHFVVAGQGQYLVMDFVEGEDLSARQERLGRLPEAEVLRWAEDVLRALAYLHTRNIVHRDIKPANIKITPEGSAVLVDFGIAKVGGAGQTTTGARGLTPGYAPPEQYGMGATEARTDLYSLGATLYHALSGEVPVNAFERTVQRAPLTPLRQAAPQVSARTAAAVEKALALALEDRWPSAEAMRQALQAPTAPAPARPRPANEPTIILPPEPATQIEPSGYVSSQAMPGPSPAASPAPVAAPPPGRAAAPAAPPPVASVPAPAGRPARRMWFGLGLAGVIGVVACGAVALAAAALGLPGLWSGAGGPPLQPKPPGLGPGTGKIAFVSDRDGNEEIYLIQAAGGSLVNLTNHPAADSQPAFSPDGQRIAFVSNRDGNNEIYLMNADGTGLTNMTNNPADDGEPAWLYDGSALAFASDRDGNFEIYIAGQSGVSRYTNHGAADLSPSWSQNGGLIAFTSGRTGNFEIFVFGPDGLAQYTHDPATDSHPRWSPAQAILAFESNREGNFDVYLFAAGGLQRHTSSAANDGEPAWSPDGAQLAFVSDRDGNPEIYITGPDGTRRLTDHPARDFYPSWQP
jgi:hypothetical protein